MLRLTLRADTPEAIYLFDENGKPMAKIMVSQQRDRKYRGTKQVGIGILAKKAVKVLRNSPHIISLDDQIEYDEYLSTPT